MKNLFKFRDKYEKIGIFLGCICFLPSFLAASYTGIFKNIILGFLTLIVCQGLWLYSISLCTMSLEIENAKLKEKLEKGDNNANK